MMSGDMKMETLRLQTAMAALFEATLRAIAQGDADAAKVLADACADCGRQYLNITFGC